jgi:hypothetical protein
VAFFAQSRKNTVAAFVALLFVRIKKPTHLSTSINQPSALPRGLSGLRRLYYTTFFESSFFLGSPPPPASLPSINQSIMAGSGDRNETLLANEEEEADDLYNDDEDNDLDNDDDDDYYLHHKDDHHDDDDDDGSSDDDNSMDDHSSTVQRRAGTYLKDRETKLVQKRINNKSTAAKEAARTANCTGYIVLTSLLVMGITLAFITYYYMSASQENDSQAQV